SRLDVRLYLRFSPDAQGHQFRLGADYPGRAGQLRAGRAGRAYRQSAVPAGNVNARRRTAMITTDPISQQPIKTNRALTVGPRGKLAYASMLVGAIAL